MTRFFVHTEFSKIFWKGLSLYSTLLFGVALLGFLGLAYFQVTGVPSDLVHYLMCAFGALGGFVFIYFLWKKRAEAQYPVTLIPAFLVAFLIAAAFLVGGLLGYVSNTPRVGV